MIKFREIISFLILLILISSCEKKTVEFEFEKAVMTEIFPSLVDSICVDSRKMLPPPMLGELVSDTEGHVSLDSTKATRAQIIEYRKWQKERERIEKDTSKVVIAFDPFLKKGDFRFSNNNNLEKKYPFLETYIEDDDTIKAYRFDYEKLKLHNNFKLKNLSEFPKGRYDIWETKYRFIFSGVLHLSRIQFNKNKKHGVLEASFTCGSLCGQGFIIFIKKNNTKWIINKIHPTWIS
jgi:hypothetical protein